MCRLQSGGATQVSAALQQPCVIRLLVLFFVLILVLVVVVISVLVLALLVPILLNLFLFLLLLSPNPPGFFFPFIRLLSFVTASTFI